VTRVLAAIVVVLSGTSAAAYEGELQGDLELGYAHLAGEDPEGPGGSGVVGVRYALTDAWNLWAAGGWALHPDSAADGSTTHVGGLGGGIEWVFDVLQIVPWAGVGLEALVFAGSDTELAAAAQVSVGADYLIKRGLSLGLVGRGRIVLSRLEEIPLQILAGLRVSVTLAD
jgi:hypothetical protein